MAIGLQSPPTTSGILLVNVLVTRKEAATPATLANAPQPTQIKLPPPKPKPVRPFVFASGGVGPQPKTASSVDGEIGTLLASTSLLKVVATIYSPHHLRPRHLRMTNLRSKSSAQRLAIRVG